MKTSRLDHIIAPPPTRQDPGYKNGPNNTPLLFLGSSKIFTHIWKTQFDCYIVQGIHSEEIIGRGKERKGIYNVYEVLKNKSQRLLMGPRNTNSSYDIDDLVTHL